MGSNRVAIIFPASLRTASRCKPNARAACRALIPSTMQARRTRAFNSTLYILYAFHRVTANTMEGVRCPSIKAPFLTAPPPAYTVHYYSALYNSTT